MARCEDCIHAKVCDSLISSGLPWNDGEYPAEAFCMAFQNTADVVPRERYNRAMDNIKAVLEERAEDKVEGALEVIGDVEKMARDYIDGIMLLDPQNTYCFGGINAFENVIKFLAELKKKYVGE